MSTAYNQGVLAWQHASPNSENPHPSGGKIGGGMNMERVDWFSGWYDAKFAEKYPQYFRVGR